MEVTNILGINSREELYSWFSLNHDKVREFWIRVDRSSKPVSGVIERCKLLIHRGEMTEYGLALIPKELL